ncbi:MAG TPA: chemotaxis protein CheD [Burkholderiaceae bacterium]|nr:chemotaxis protein CheD [Burkholderiaceae bacterium]
MKLHAKLHAKQDARHGRHAREAHPTHVLHPGDVVVATRGHRLETLLGSCVAIILTDPARTVGAMSHVVHTGPMSVGSPSGTMHGESALQRMFALLRECALNPLMCEAYVIGGGNMFPRLVAGDTVGEANIRWALDALSSRGIRTLATDAGGTTYRRLRWTVGPSAPDIVAVDVRSGAPQPGGR